MRPRFHGVGGITTLLFGCWLASASAGELPQPESLVFDIGHKHVVASSVLGGPIELVVHLPAGYSTGTGRHPVLLFLGSNARAKFAQAAATLDCMTDGAQLPGVILVGVDLPHGNFVLVPREDAAGTASADRHLAALAEDVIPFVDRTFRTNGYRILYGASNSGAFVVYALLSARLPCQAFIASSPMLGWCPGVISEKARTALADAKRPNQFLFLIDSDDDYEKVTGELPAFESLLRKSQPGWLRWKSETRHNEGHVPEMDVSLGLRALFPDYNPEAEFRTLQALQTHFSALSARYGFAIDVPGPLLFDLGFTLANGGQLDEAQGVFEFGVERYPQEADMHAGLGYVQKRRGHADVALGHFKRAVAINPEHWSKRELPEAQKTKGETP